MKNKTSLIIYTVSHMVVDFSCFYVLMGAFSKQIDSATLPLGLLIYNILAFGLQMFIGYFADTYAVEHSRVAFWGCMLVCVGVLVTDSPWLALLFCGIGNASFHIGGGINSLVYSEGKMARGGIFVSSGAIGVTLGTIAGLFEIPLIISIILLLMCSYAIRFCCVTDKNKVIPNFDEPNISKPIISSATVIIWLCFISIFIRSYVGNNIEILWTTSAFLYILPSICAFAGKFSGGILADYFGGRNVGVLSLLLSIPLLCFFNSNILLCSIGLVLFNMTMSITLWGIALQLRNKPGFAFGLTTLALLIGNMPLFLFKLPQDIKIIVLPLLIIVSSICIFVSIQNKQTRIYNAKQFNEFSE